MKDIWCFQKQPGSCIGSEILLFKLAFNIVHWLKAVYGCALWPSVIIVQSFLQGLLMKDPRQRLSWPELLYHPFIAGWVTGEYKLTYFLPFFPVCFFFLNLPFLTDLSLSKTSHSSRPFLAVIDDTAEQGIANPFTSKLPPELQALKEQQAHSLAPHSGLAKILRKARQKMAQEARRKVRGRQCRPWEGPS